METIVLQKGRESIDRPVERGQEASNPSPSQDPWFDDPDNMAALMRGIEDARQGRTRAYTMEELERLLGI